MRVLISGHLPPPVGGMGTYYRTLLDSSLSKKVELTFVQTHAHLQRLPAGGSPVLANLRAALQDWRTLTRAILANQPQIVHIGTTYGSAFFKYAGCVTIARCLGKCVILHPHGSLSAMYTQRSWLWRWYFRRLVRRTDGVVALSQEWMQLSQIVRGLRVTYLPNAVDVANYRPIAEERLSAAPRTEGLCRVLYLGSLGQFKGSYDLIAAAALLAAAGRPMIFDLVGEELAPGEIQTLERQIESAGLADYVHLGAPAYGKDELERFRAADIFVYPSYQEGMPIAVLEAMACALPIVATRVGGLPDLVREGWNGILVDPQQPEQLANALQEIWTNTPMRRAMQNINAQLSQKQYDIENHVDQLIQLYEVTLADRRHAA